DIWRSSTRAGWTCASTGSTARAAWQATKATSSGRSLRRTYGGSTSGTGRSATAPPPPTRPSTDGRRPAPARAAASEWIRTAPARYMGAMLLAVDVGNTNTVIGAYEGKRLVEHFRLETHARRTPDEWGLLCHQALRHYGIDPAGIRAVAVSSVVPPLQHALERMSARYFGCKPLFVGPGVKTGMPILYDNPREVGADRIVNAVAAYERWPGPLIVVDFGTATTFDVVTAKGEYLGGAITPGIHISVEALSRNASK